MPKKYLLPCAGYDRPGGNLSRVVAEQVVKSREDVVIGSMGALFKERPGEMRDFRTSEVICLDGCGTHCASELAKARGRDDVAIISVPEVAGSTESDEEKAKLVIESLQPHLVARESKSTPQTIEKPSFVLEFMEEKFDKFTLRVAKGLKYSDNDFWARIEGENIRIGASDLLQQMTSDIYYVNLVDPGQHVDTFDDAGSLESTKILVEIIVPVSGTIIEANDMLEDSPELVNESPYDRGWLYLIRPDDIDELELLRDAPDYLEYALKKAKDEIGKKVE